MEIQTLNSQYDGDGGNSNGGRKTKTIKSFYKNQVIAPVAPRSCLLDNPKLACPLNCS